MPVFQKKSFKFLLFKLNIGISIEDYNIGVYLVGIHVI